MTEPEFTDLIDLASDAVGGAAIACSDDFFAPMENLVKPAPAVWKDHEYTDRGKWMDGWESRRRRPPLVGPSVETDHDWCIVRLGLPGIIRGVVVDTAWFRGNFPTHAAIYATSIDAPLDVVALEGAKWTELVPRAALAGDTRNLFAVDDRRRYTHLRLEIYPDGGVARLRVHGEVVPDWARLRGAGGLVDLAALDNGAVVETCSDMFFGSRNNLIKPGPSLSMADGWETRRRRGPGNDWAIVRLASAGTIERVEIDTRHFKGNAPARFALEGAHAPGAMAVDLGAQVEPWRTLVESRAQPHTRHVFTDELRRIGPITHLRLSVFPCGGIARLRAWGNLRHESAGVAALNAMTSDAARSALLACCGARAWAEQMTALRPFEDVPALHRIAERVWWSLDEAAHREAFAAHPRIGELSASSPALDAETTGRWTREEQRGAASASERTAAELARLNRVYADKHGMIFLICATGRSAEAMLAELIQRVERPTAVEFRTAAEEQCKITRLRLTKLIAGNT